jgi:hypothetical protein
MYIQKVGGPMPEGMKRTQIYLEPALDEDLRRLAARRGVSKAQLLREGAYRIVREERAAEEDSILGVIGLGDSEPPPRTFDARLPYPQSFDLGVVSTVWTGSTCWTTTFMVPSRRETPPRARSGRIASKRSLVLAHTSPWFPTNSG